jgi:hypothetical protein
MWSEMGHANRLEFVGLRVLQTIHENGNEGAKPENRSIADEIIASFEESV